MSLGYTESTGLPALREEIASMYGPNVNADDVLVLAPEEGIFLSMQALLQPGDEVSQSPFSPPDLVYPQPSFLLALLLSTFQMENQATSAGC